MAVRLDADRLERLKLTAGATIREAMTCIDASGAEIALVVEPGGYLVGTLTDGDVRRSLLGGASLEDPVRPHVASRPITVQPGESRAAVLDLMQARSVSHLPIVDPHGVLVGVHLLREVIGEATVPNVALVVAGGRGTRLGRLTRTTPKPMLPIAGRPILERIVLHLVGSGFRRIVLSIGYLGEQIVDHFGTGERFGCHIDYVVESEERPLGTGGPIRLLRDLEDPPRDPVLVMNGDLLTTFSIEGLLAAHLTHRPMMTIGLQQYVHDIPFGVVSMDERTRLVSHCEEKPRAAWLVNAGVYVVETELAERIPPDENVPITDLVQRCLDLGEPVIGHELDGDWQDIGRPHELRAARGED